MPFHAKNIAEKKNFLLLQKENYNFYEYILKSTKFC